MSYIELPATYLLTNNSWTPTTGSYSSGNNSTNYPFCVRAHGSGDWIYNFPGFTTVAQWQVFSVLSSIPFGSTINTVHFLAWFDTVLPGLNLDTHYNPPFGPSSGNVPSTGGPQLIDLDLAGQSFNRFDLQNAVLQVAASTNIATAAHCDYVAFAIDYTPPNDALVVIWVAGAYAPDCPQPPPRKFRPFGIYDTAGGLEQAVTADWMRKYGKPPAGFNVWCYYRASNYDGTPAVDSPSVYFTLGPWPTPG